MKSLSVVSLLVASSLAALPTFAHNHGNAHGAMHQSMPQVSTQAIHEAPVSSTILVSECWIRALPAPAPSGGFFSVKNTGSSDVKLVAAASPSYLRVMLHQTTQSGGMSRMSEVHNVTVAAGRSLSFKPGNYHAMLEKAASNVTVGSVITLNLLFDNGHKAVAKCEVMPANTRGR